MTNPDTDHKFHGRQTAHTETRLMFHVIAGYCCEFLKLIGHVCGVMTVFRQNVIQNRDYALPRHGGCKCSQEITWRVSTLVFAKRC